MPRANKDPDALDPVRRLIFDLCAAHPDLDYKALSQRLGMNDSYIHQYLWKGSPRVLPEDIRHGIARAFGKPEHLFRAAALSEPARGYGEAPPDAPAMDYGHEVSVDDGDRLSALAPRLDAVYREAGYALSIAELVKATYDLYRDILAEAPDFGDQAVEKALRSRRRWLIANRAGILAPSKPNHG